jgi:phosphoenolpyruvate-protein kinase (PTS system EI component)
MSVRRVFGAGPVPAEDTGRATVVIGRLRHSQRVAASTFAGDARAAVAAAFDSVPGDLERLAVELGAQGLVEPAQIVTASIQIARDPDLRDLVDRKVAAGAAPPEAMIQAAEHFAQILADLDDPLLAARATDVRAVGQRLAAAATGTAPSFVEPVEAVILAGWEVTADDLLLAAGSVAGAVTVVGGATAHVGIVARSLGIPILFGVERDALDLPEGTELMLDTRQGRLVVEPTDAERDLANADAAALDARRARLAARRSAPLSTRDGGSVAVLANVASAAEAELAVRMGASGVGLLRTEMPFLGAQHWPTFERHLVELTSVLRPIAGRPVTVRTLDFADDKIPPFLRAGRSGPLGPGLPLLLAEPEAFGAQLRAILEAGIRCDISISIMIPMVDSAATLEQCRALVATAAASLSVPLPPVGAMVELQEAIDAIGDLARASDFLSIGTNDLTASILGLGRRDPSLTPDRLREPAVLDAVARTIRAGHDHDRTVSVCGDAASDPKLVPDLLDLGCRVLSVAPSMMDEVRAAVRAHAQPTSDRLLPDS